MVSTKIISSRRYHYLEPLKACRKTYSQKMHGCVQAEGATKSHKVRVDTFPRGSLLMNELMDRVMAAVRPNDLLRQKLYQVNFHTTLSGNSMVRSCFAITSDK